MASVDKYTKMGAKRANASRPNRPPVANMKTKAPGGSNFDGMTPSRRTGASIPTGDNAQTANHRPNSATAPGISTLGTKAEKFSGKLLRR